MISKGDALFIPTWTTFLEANWSQILLGKTQNAEIQAGLGNSVLMMCPTECPSHFCCHRVCISCAFLVVSWGWCLFDLFPSGLYMFLWSSSPRLIFEEVHTLTWRFERDAQVLSVALGSDMRGRHSFPHFLLYLYSRDRRGPQSCTSFCSAPGELGTLWDIPSSPLCFCIGTGVYQALPLRIIE